MYTRLASLAIALLLGIPVGTWAAPLAGAWNIAPSGNAASSGELLFRVVPGDTEQDPIEVTVSVMSGSNDVAIARDIRRSFAAQLRADRFNVELGQGANVLLTDPRGQPNFSVELVDSDVENLRVLVAPANPTAPPTVPTQATPATPPATPAPTTTAPGNAQPAPTTPSPGNAGQPAAPPPQNSPPPPGSTPGATPAPGGAPASAPPPGG